MAEKRKAPETLENADVGCGGAENSILVVHEIKKVRIFMKKFADGSAVVVLNNNTIRLLHENAIVFEIEVQFPHPYSEILTIIGAHNGYVYLVLTELDGSMQNCMFILNMLDGKFTKIPYSHRDVYYRCKAISKMFLALEINDKESIARLDDIENGIYDKLYFIDHSHILYCDDKFIIQWDAFNASRSRDNVCVSLIFKIYSSETLEQIYTHNEKNKIYIYVRNHIKAEIGNFEFDKILKKNVKNMFRDFICVADQSIIFSKSDVIINFRKKELEKECCACMENMKKIMQFYPCAHAVCCEECGSKIINSVLDYPKCPICRGDVKWFSVIERAR